MPGSIPCTLRPHEPVLFTNATLRNNLARLIFAVIDFLNDINLLGDLLLGIGVGAGDIDLRIIHKFCQLEPAL
jgi:hypothetical protein